jgi:uncharacterized protein (TIGR02145 family)
MEIKNALKMFFQRRPDNPPDGKGFIYFDRQTGKPVWQDKNGVHEFESTQVQADWEQEDDVAVDYIKHKPTIREAVNYPFVVDPSDNNRKYRVGLMPDGHWWLAENYAHSQKGRSYLNDASYDSVYGKYYKWDDQPQPATWTVPSMAQLIEFIHVCSTAYTSTSVNNGLYMLRSRAGWEDDIVTFDPYGFSLLPAGEWSGSRENDSAGAGSFVCLISGEHADTPYLTKILYAQSHNHNLYPNTMSFLDSRGSLRCIVPASEVENKYLNNYVTGAIVGNEVVPKTGSILHFPPPPVITVGSEAPTSGFKDGDIFIKTS